MQGYLPGESDDRTIEPPPYSEIADPNVRIFPKPEDLPIVHTARSSQRRRGQNTLPIAPEPSSSTQEEATQQGATTTGEEPDPGSTTAASAGTSPERGTCSSSDDDGGFRRWFQRGTRTRRSTAEQIEACRPRRRSSRSLDRSSLRGSGSRRNSSSGERDRAGTPERQHNERAKLARLNTIIKNIESSLASHTGPQDAQARSTTSGIDNPGLIRGDEGPTNSRHDSNRSTSSGRTSPEAIDEARIQDSRQGQALQAARCIATGQLERLGNSSVGSNDMPADELSTDESHVEPTTGIVLNPSHLNPSVAYDCSQGFDPHLLDMSPPCPRTVPSRVRMGTKSRSLNVLPGSVPMSIYRETPHNTDASPPRRSYQGSTPSLGTSSKSTSLGALHMLHGLGTRDRSSRSGAEDMPGRGSSPQPEAQGPRVSSSLSSRSRSLGVLPGAMEMQVYHTSGSMPQHIDSGRQQQGFASQTHSLDREVGHPQPDQVVGHPHPDREVGHPQQAQFLRGDSEQQPRQQLSRGQYTRQHAPSLGNSALLSRRDQQNIAMQRSKSLGLYPGSVNLSLVGDVDPRRQSLDLGRLSDGDSGTGNSRLGLSGASLFV